MDEQIIKYYGAEIEEHKFHQYKTPLSINDIDINNIVVPDKFHFGKQDFEYFIGYRDSERIRPLCIFRPQMLLYKTNFDKIDVFIF